MSASFDTQIINLLKNGGVGFMPSDTIYGLSAAALNEQAVAKLHEIKDRQANRSFIILFSDIKMLNMLSIDEKQILKAKKYWPGGLSIICEAPKSPKWLHLGFQTLAVRIPASQELLKLIKEVGPLVSTSANPEGQKPATSISQAIEYFGDHLDFYIDAGDINGKPSTLVKLNDGKLEVIRTGVVKI